MSNSIPIAVSEKVEIPPMTRIPKDTLKSWETELSGWTQPSAFRARIDQITQTIPKRTFFGQGGLAFLRDAWIASRLVSALPSDMVRLVASDRPDFEIQTCERIEQFEATEADMDGRRRGDEPDDQFPQPDPVENWRQRFEAIPAALDRVVTKKLGKDYSSEINLAIYVNLGCYGAYVKRACLFFAITQLLPKLTSSAFLCFGKVVSTNFGKMENPSSRDGRIPVQKTFKVNS